MAKIKIGKRYRFDFAGMEYEGELFDIEKIQSTINVNHVWYKIKHDDGTIYPLPKERLKEINK